MKAHRYLLLGWVALVLVNFTAASPYPYHNRSRIGEWLKLPSFATVHTLPASGVAREWSHAAGALALAGVAATSLAGWGGPLVDWTRFGRPLIGGLAAALGLGAVGLVLFGLGLAGLLYQALIWAVLAPGLVLAVQRIRMKYRESRVSIFELRRKGWIWWVGALVVIVYALAALNPDPGIDAWVYHLRLPFYYLLHHRVYDVWHHIHAHVPQLWEIILVVFPPGLADTAAQAASVLTLIPVFALLVRLGGEGAVSRLFALLFISSPLLVATGASAYTDGPMLWLSLLAFSLIAGRESATPGARFVSGIVLGLACSLKYAAFPAVVAQAAAVAWLSYSLRRRFWGAPVLAGLLAAFLPWAAWNWLAVGNPVAPFLSRLFPAALAPLPFAEKLSASVFSRSTGDVLAAVWNAYVASGPFLFLAPLLVALFPVLVLRGTTGPLIGLWLVAFLVTWSVFMADERFGLAAVAVATAALARAVSIASGIPWTKGRTAIAVWALFIVLNLAGVAREVFLPYPRLLGTLGLISRGDYPAYSPPSRPGFLPAAAWINAETAVGDRILFVSDSISPRIWRECIHDHVMDYPSRLIYLLWKIPHDPRRIGARFRQLGIRWVLYLPVRNAARLREMPDLFPFDPENARAFYEFWLTRSTRAAVFDRASIYRIDARPHHPRPVADVPGLQDVIFMSVEAARARAGDRAGLAELRRYEAGYPLIGSVRRALGRAMLANGADEVTRAEAVRHIRFAAEVEKPR
jgi:hypothetical protein